MYGAACTGLDACDEQDAGVFHLDGADGCELLLQAVDEFPAQRQAVARTAEALFTLRAVAR